jgi:DNA repair exonuclease SbcCD ATPase subunit
MNQLWTAIITTICTVVVSLVVTYIFNKLSGVPKKLADEKAARQQKIADLETKIDELDTRLLSAEEAIGHYPEYRAQSLQIQGQLQQADQTILEACDAIKAIGEQLNTRLEDLERREKNSLRAKILNEYRLYTDSHKNPLLAWTEMEHHSFFKLVEDYESLGGNDYVHSVVLPAMNELDVIPMHELIKIKELYDSRSAK